MKLFEPTLSSFHWDDNPSSNAACKMKNWDSLLSIHQKWWYLSRGKFCEIRGRGKDKVVGRAPNQMVGKMDPSVAMRSLLMACFIANAQVRKSPLIGSYNKHCEKWIENEKLEKQTKLKVDITEGFICMLKLSYLKSPWSLTNFTNIQLKMWKKSIVYIEYFSNSVCVPQQCWRGHLKVTL